MNSNKTVSVLGAGWLGFELALSLISQGYRVKGSTTTPSKIDLLESKGIDPYLIDLSGEAIQSPFFEADILIINIPPGRRDPDVAINYPKRIEKALQAAKEGGVKHVILISSTGVFASGVAEYPEWEFPMYSDHPTNVDDKSASALIEAERMLQQFYNANGSIIRFGGLVGGERLAGRFLAGKKDITDGAAPVNMIHRDDCIGIIKAVIEKGTWGKTYNATSDGHPSRRDFYTAQANKYGFELPTFLDEDQAIGKVISNIKLKEGLKYHFIHPDPMLF